MFEIMTTPKFNGIFEDFHDFNKTIFKPAISFYDGYQNLNKDIEDFLESESMLNLIYTSFIVRYNGVHINYDDVNIFKIALINKIVDVFMSLILKWKSLIQLDLSELQKLGLNTSDSQEEHGENDSPEQGNVTDYNNNYTSFQERTKRNTVYGNKLMAIKNYITNGLKLDIDKLFEENFDELFSSVKQLSFNDCWERELPWND